MPTEMGEYLVGAYLKLIEDCDFVDYNVRTPGGGLAGLNEIDVVGINFNANTAYLCEVTTHIRGVLYGNNKDSLERIQRKYRNLKEYAESHLIQFEHNVFMFWSPNVPKGFMTKHLAQIDGLKLVINGEYKRCVRELRKKARTERQDTGNPAFRVIQILGSLRD